MKLLLMVIAFLCHFRAFARPPEEAEFLAAKIGAEEIAEWIVDIKDVPRSISVFSVKVNEPLEQDYGAIVENEILKYLKIKGIDKVSSCLECRSLQVGVSGENLIIQKGAPDLDTLKKIGANQAVDAFLIIDVYRTKLAIVMQATIYKNPTATVIAAERFRIPALSFTDAAVQVLITLGEGKILDLSRTLVDPGLTPSISIHLLEELGIGKGGIGIGAILCGSTLIFLEPTYSFRNRIGSSGLGWSLNLGAGFGIYGQSQGVAVRGALEFYIGSITVIGAEFHYFSPLNNTRADYSTYAGVHLGLSFGR